MLYDIKYFNFKKRMLNGLEAIATDGAFIFFVRLPNTSVVQIRVEEVNFIDEGDELYDGLKSSFKAL